MDDIGVDTKLDAAEVKTIQSRPWRPHSVRDLCDDWLKWQKEFKLLRDANQHTRNDLDQERQRASDLYHENRSLKFKLEDARLFAEFVVTQVDAVARTLTLQRLKDKAKEFLHRL